MNIVQKRCYFKLEKIDLRKLLTHFFCSLSESEFLSFMNSIFKRIINIISVLLIAGCTSNDIHDAQNSSLSTFHASQYKGFTLEQSRNFHRKYAPDWIKGGELVRYLNLNFSEFYRHSVINRAGKVKELLYKLREDVSNFITKTNLGDLPLKEYIYNSHNIDGVIVVHKGKIVFEDYPRMQSYEKHIYYSVSKVFVSIAVAILEDRNLVDVSNPIDFYISKLKGSAWEKTKIIDILDMSSGINCPTDLEDERSCFQQNFGAYGWAPLQWPSSAENALEDPIDNFITMERLRPPGQVFEYADINTIILTILVERITGISFTDFMEQEIWHPMGAESDGLMLNAGYGRAATPLGVSSTLRDMARFGLLFTPSGRNDSHQPVSNAYLEQVQFGCRPELFAAGQFPNLFRDDSELCNTYQWDNVTKEGDFYKHGSGGQGLYISPSRDLVIAFFGTPNRYENQMPAVARQLAKSGLFDL